MTVDNEKRPEGDGYVAVISYGSPQLGDDQVEVCSVKVVRNMKEAKIWFRQMLLEKPWETRN